MASSNYSSGFNSIVKAVFVKLSQEAVAPVQMHSAETEGLSMELRHNNDSNWLSISVEEYTG